MLLIGLLMKFQRVIGKARDRRNHCIRRAFGGQWAVFGQIQMHSVKKWAAALQIKPRPGTNANDCIDLGFQYCQVLHGRKLQPSQITRQIPRTRDKCVR
jgi:hypothetical protein